MPSFRGRLRAPKITFSKLGQIVYTIRRVFILMMEVSPRLFLLYTVLSIFSTLLSFPSLWVGKLLLDTLVEGIRNQSIDLLPRLGFFIGLSVSLNLFSIILERIENFLDRILSQKFESKLVVKIGRKLAELDLATIEDPKFQNKYKKIEQEATRRAYALLSPTVDIIASGLALISAISILFFVSPLIAVGIILFSLPRVFSNSYFIRKRYEFVTEASPIRRVIGWLNYYLVRNINFMELKILNLTGYFSLRQDTLQDDLLRRETSLRKRWEISNTLSFLPLLIFDGICEFWLGVRAIYGIITLGSFQFYSSTLQRAQGNFRSLVSSIMDVYEHYLYVSDLTWFLSLVPKIDNLSGIDVGLVQQPSIQFKNVWFRYKKSSSWILKNMNFSIAPGENIAIVGVNGSGKSTLIKLLSRFYDPQRGGVYMNELNLSEVQPVAWRQNLAVLFQEFESYPFTARESISYGDVSRLHDTDAVKMAAKLTGIDSYIEKLPLKYENPLDPQFSKGVRPSAGQRQRIGISRMLFRKNASVLILDEPTSNVDPEAEEKIFQELIKITQDKTLIFVTQRFSTVRLADRIFVVDNGSIIEEGTHHKLMTLKGKYHELFQLQAKGYK